MKRIRTFLAALAALIGAASGLRAAETPVPINLSILLKQPVAIAYNPVNDHIYVLDIRPTFNLNSSGFVHVVDTRTNTFIRMLQMGKFSKGISVDGYHNKIYVTNSLDSTIGIIDGSNDFPVEDGSGNARTIRLVANPAAIAFSYYTSYTYVSYHDNVRNIPAVAVVDGVTDSVIGTITGFGKEISALVWPVQGSIAHLMLAVGGGSPATAYAIQTSGGAGSIVRTIDVGNVNGPFPTMFRPMAGENSRAATYVANGGSNTVTEINEYQNSTTTISVPGFPVGIAGEDHWTAGGGHVYVACLSAGTVVEITGHSVTRSWGGFSSPTAVQYDPKNHSLYVADSSRLYVLKI